MKARSGVQTALLLAGALSLSACNTPKRAHYTSIWGDYRCDVPFGWRVFTSSEKGRFTNTTFVGPFDPGFLMGAPSLSVRWHAYNQSHRLPDGQLEIYSSVDDYVRQVLESLYQPHQTMIKPVETKDIAGRKAKYFVVSSPARVPANLKWGTVLDADTGQPYNVREHAYLVIPGSGGFYVLIYPATKEGYAAYRQAFDDLAFSFKILKDGPEGPAVEGHKSLP